MLVEEARKRHLNHELYWAADLMVELENRRQGGALDWAIECAKALVASAAPPDQEQLTRWLLELSSLIHGTVSCPDLMERGQQIWHQQRDLLHTTISHLYAAADRLAQKNIPWYRRSVVSAMDVMGRHDFYRRTSVAAPLALFEKEIEKREKKKSGAE